MAPQTNKDLWKPWAELWNGNLSIADEIIAPEFVAHFAPAGGSPGEVRGPEGLKQWIGGSLAAFTDYRFTTTVGPLADEDKVIGRWTFRATYQGGIPGSPPTAIGTQIEYSGIDILRVESGKLVEYWLCADILQMLQQVGVIPSWLCAHGQSQWNGRESDGGGAMIAKEMVLPGIGAPETLEVRRRELPAPVAGEVTVRVEVTGVSFAEQSMRRGRYPGQPRFPFVPGYDLVGIVTARGPGVTEFTIGQRVAALTKTGGWADHVVLPAVSLVPVPDGVAAAEAESGTIAGKVVLVPGLV